MTTRYEVTPASYGNLIHLLKRDDIFSLDEWAQIRSKMEWDINAECCAIFEELSNCALTSGPWLEDFVRIEPDDLLIGFTDMKLTDVKAQIFKDFSFYFRKMERLEQLQEYLREIKQLD